MAQPIQILLGRTGDVLTLLPLLHDSAQSGVRQSLMVAKEYAPLMDGVSYVDCIPFDGQMWEIERAVLQAKSLSDNVSCVQISGPPDQVKKHVFAPRGIEGAVMDCWQRELWALAGKRQEWHKHLPLVFDRRDRQREEKLITQTLPNKKKVILVAASGHSSPFPYRDLLLEILRLKFSRKYNIVDISAIQAERVYDLLGLFEHPNIHCLIATDSAPLHLANACKVPVVALTNDAPGLWYGSARRANHVFYSRYSDFPKRSVEMLDAISVIRKPGCYFFTNCVEHSPKFFHVWNHYELSGQNKAQHEDAKASWREMYKDYPAFISSAIDVGSLGQDSASALKDSVRFPLLKSAIQLAMQRMVDGDVIVLTRPETKFRSGGLDDWMNAASTRPVFCHRNLITEHGPQYHAAVDLFAFTKQWWNEHSVEMPDMAWGQDLFWQYVLKEIVKRHGGVEFPSAVYRMASPPVPLPREGPPKYYVNNETMYKAWVEKMGIKASARSIDGQLPTLFVNRRSLFSLGYNPSIIRYDGKLLMTYRYHHDGTAATQLAIAELDDAGNVLNNSKLNGQGHSLEDGRLFIFKGQLCICYVESQIGSSSHNCVTKYGRIVRDKEWSIADTFQPQYGKNAWDGMEKNWVMFEQEGRLFCIYQSSPKQIVLELDGAKVVATHESDSPHWRYGAVKGGSVPMPYDGKLIRFFHARLDNEAPPTYWRYRMGVCLMEPTPPFKIISIAEKPLLEGTEVDDLSQTERFSCHHHKQRVVIPYGAIETPTSFLVACGVNDSQCGLVKVKKEDLKL